MESTTLKQDGTSQPGTGSKTSKQGVFLKRGKGQSFEEYRKACIASLKAAGLIKAKSTTPSEELPDEQELADHNKFEEGLPELIQKYGLKPESTTPGSKEQS